MFWSHTDWSDSDNRSDERGDFVESLLLDFRDSRAVSGITGDNQKKGSLVCWPAEYLVQEPHWTGRVSQRGQSCVVYRSQENARGNPHGLGGVVVFDLPTIGQYTEVLDEDADQVGSGLDEGFVRVSAQRGQSVQPLLRGAMIVKFLLFLLGGDPNSAFGGGVRDRYETPRLHIGPTRSGSGSP